MSDDAVVEPRRSNAVRWTALGVGAVMVLLVVLLIVSKQADEGSGASAVVGKQAPALAGDALIGQPFDVGTNDRWLVVNFFATWCAPCVQEHPELRKLAEDGAKDGSIQVVSVAYDDEASEVEDFFRERGGDWTVLDSDDGRTALDWGVAKVPESFVVAPNGLVVERLQGGVRAREVEDLIAASTEQGS
ncbi:MAG: TlpA family protein disulfide reductase [Acidimicrobiales bacterium]|nr:TlpA family protein disulfide reductase [Acidimicrobiales bacterium]HRW37327.1 TlpA disulfide reductase family protein [Aquihabitans sp.]